MLIRRVLIRRVLIRRVLIRREVEECLFKEGSADWREALIRGECLLEMSDSRKKEKRVMKSGRRI